MDCRFDSREAPVDGRRCQFLSDHAGFKIEQEAVSFASFSREKPCDCVGRRRCAEEGSEASYVLSVDCARVRGLAIEESPVKSLKPRNGNSENGGVLSPPMSPMAGNGGGKRVLSRAEGLLDVTRRLGILGNR